MDKKKLEPEISDFLQKEYKSCSMCLGFYGANYGQPVCSTCHLFLFPKDINVSEDGLPILEAKPDSGDSGNEEPRGENDFYVKPRHRETLAAAIGSAHSKNMSAASPPNVKKNVPSRPGRGEVNDRSMTWPAAYHALNDMSGESGGLNLGSSRERVMPLVNSRAAMIKTDKLAERVYCLTVGRDFSIPEGLFDSLPPEVILVVFHHLDDISLWKAGRVCSRWRQILDSEYCDATWERFVCSRWPLYRPQFVVHSWKTIYTKLLESAPCLYCLENMMLQSCLPIEENSWRHRRLRSELKTLRSDPPEGIQATPLDRLCCHWQASITGPQGSPYEGGLFLLYLQIPESYPMRPPVVRFITKIFHPNVSRHGDVGLDSIHDNWSLALTISKVLISIQSLLTDPFTYVCMEPAVGKLYQRDRNEFRRIARLWSWKYAMHDFLMPCYISLKGT